MKKISILVLVFWSFNLLAQTPSITKNDIEAAEKFLDLSFTEPERDSMLMEVIDNIGAVKTLHSYHLENAVTPVLYFNPLPSHFKMPVGQKPINWSTPSVELPKKRADLAFYTIPQLAQLIKNKKITSVELTRFFIERIKKYSDTLHCTITITEETALKQAQQADEELAKGKYRGVLHGIPYGIKDLLAVKGTKTTWGAAPFKNQIIDETATVVEKLQAAGGVLVAKLTLGALAMGDIWYGGKTRNPWNLLRGSSGSSAGSASAVVAGLVPFAIGSETLGSIVSPSTECGATGLRPTFGRVSRHGAMTLCWSLDKLGPITRSAEDAAIVLEAIRGEDGRDKTVMNAPFNFNASVDIKKLRIGYPTNVFDSLKKTRNEWKTLETLEKMGAKLIPMELKTKVSPRIIDLILMGECAAAFDELTRTNLDDELTVQTKNAWPNYFRSARFISAVDYINANRLRSQLIEEMNDLMKNYDVIVTSNFGVNQLQITNMTGHPVVVLPNGFSEGRPTTISFLGNLFDEATILSLAKAFQDKTDFEDKHPEMFQDK